MVILSVANMYKFWVSVLLIINIYHHKAVDAQSQTCSQMEKMEECLPDIRKFMDSPVSLTMVKNAASGGQNVTRRCQQLNQFLACVDEKMRDCRVVTDAQDQRILFWENAKKGAKFMCTEQPEAFAKHHSCLSSDAAGRALLACDLDDSHSRHKRHSCDDYDDEIMCADRVVTETCGTEAARLVGQLARIFLKNTPHTKDCTAPEFKVTSGSTIGMISLPLLLGAWLITMKW